MKTTKDLVEDWFEGKDINPDKQLIKLQEELGELANSYLKDRQEELEDAIGDVQVVLIGFCKLLGIDYDYCLEMAYDTIKDRKITMKDGVAVKEEDLL